VYESYSPEVGDAFEPDNMLDYSWAFKAIVSEFPDYPLIIASGEYDMHDGGASQSMWMNPFLFPANDTFWRKDRSIYYFKGQDES